MQRATWMTSALLLCWTSASVANGQTVLRELGNILQQATTRPADAPPGEGDAAAGLGFTGSEQPGQEGVLVDAVEEGGAAHQAGLAPGDRIVAIEGTAVKGFEDITRLLSQQPVGRTVEIRIVRDAREQTLNLKLVAATQEPAAPAEEVLPSPAPGPEQETAPPVLGVSLAGVSPELQARFGFRAREGAVIVGVVPNSPAHRYRLPIGGVIVNAGGLAITRPEELEELVAGLKPGDELELTYLVRDQRRRTRVRLSVAGPPAAPAPVEPRLAPPVPGLGELAERLSRDGRRPLLGQLGRMLDEMIAEPPPGIYPPAEQNGLVEERTLAEEIALLRREVELLRQRVEALESRLPPGNTRP